MSPEPKPVHEPPAAPELVQDDEIIGRAFRWSLLAIVALGAIVGLVLWLAREREVDPEVIDRPPIEAPGTLDQSTPQRPTVAFVDVTAGAGIDFVHENGATGDKLLPETMGSGAAFFDGDGDGDQDLLLVNAAPWPERRWSGPLPTAALYRNDGRGNFADVTAGSGLDVSLYGTGVAVGDVDGDGLVDVFVAALGTNRLFRNVGGLQFEEITTGAGVGGEERAWSTAAGFLDIDNDGDLDLFVCNYVVWSREIDFEVDYRLDGTNRAYGPPRNFAGTYPYLYRNEGDGTFTDISAEAGVRIDNPATGEPVAKALAVTFVDVDRDGFADVLVANDTVRNFAFRNLGGGRFEETGAEAGLAYDAMGNATGAMGEDAADFRNDGRLGVGIGNFANESSSFYVQQGGAWQFADMANVEGIGSPSRLKLSFGLFFFDYDLDGRLDLLQANGHLEEEISTIQPSQAYRQPAQLFWNRGPAARSWFAAVPEDELGDLGRPIVGRGAAYADVDGDGDLDVLLTQAAGPPLLIRNDQATGHRWLRVKLRGRRTNRDAIGAWVELDAGGVTMRRQVMPARSYLCQVELPVTFGLGEQERVDGLRVFWPRPEGGYDVQTVEVEGVDRVVEIDETP